MTDINTIKFLSLTGLASYDTKIKEFIGNVVAAGDAQSFKYVNLENGILKFYTVNPIVEGSVPTFEIELPEQDLSHLMALVTDAVEGNVAVFGTGGQVKDSGIKAADLATKTEVQEARDAGNAAMTAVTTLEEGQVAKNTKAIGTLDDLETTAKEDLVKAINEVRNAVSVGGTASAITVDTTTTTEGYLKSYTFKQGDNVITTVDIPKELMAVSGQVVVNPEGQPEGTYIELIIQNGEPVYVDVASLVENYVAKGEATQVQIAIDADTREISATLVTGSVGTDELADNAVTTVKIADANVTKAKLSTEVQASLDKADVAEENAKKYIDEQIAGVDLTGIATNASDIDKIEASLAEGGATYTSIATAQATAQQAQDEVDALETLHAEDKAALQAKDTEIEGKVTTLQEDVTALKAVEHVEISEDEILAMFE